MSFDHGVNNTINTSISPEEYHKSYIHHTINMFAQSRVTAMTLSSNACKSVNPRNVAYDISIDACRAAKLVHYRNFISKGVRHSKVLNVINYELVDSCVKLDVHVGKITTEEDHVDEIYMELAKPKEYAAHVLMDAELYFDALEKFYANVYTK